MVYVLITFVTDWLYTVVDPRISFQRKGKA
jgi:peptide/nickel transport system permease protein